MPPTKCPGCGTPIEDRQAPCPTCGYIRNPDLKKRVLQFIVLFAILGVLWLLMLTKDLWLG